MFMLAFENKQGEAVMKWVDERWDRKINLDSRAKTCA